MATDDLVMARLLESPQVTPRADTAASVVANAIAVGRSDVSRLAKQHPLVSLELSRLVADYAPLLHAGSGLGNLQMLLGEPQRIVHLATRMVMLSSFQVGAELVVVTADWPVTRRVDRTIEKLGEGTVDEYRIPADERRLAEALRRLAAASGFQPVGGLRVGTFVTTSIASQMPDAIEILSSAGAVAGGSMSFAPSGDPSDTVFLKSARLFASSNTHQLIVTLSSPNERWVANLISGEKRQRPWIRLPYADLDNAAESLAAHISTAVREGPPYPLTQWGNDALRAVEPWEGPSFRLSEQAKRNLRRNRYPDVARMLNHLEQLASLAQDWYDAVGYSGRFEDWAATATGLKLAMSDRNISPKDAILEFEGDRLDNRPHVKVDDYTDSNHCGRIYFALDGDNRRIVVDRIGLHDRY